MPIIFLNNPVWFGLSLKGDEFLTQKFRNKSQVRTVCKEQGILTEWACSTEVLRFYNWTQD